MINPVDSDLINYLDGIKELARHVNESTGVCIHPRDNVTFFDMKKTETNDLYKHKSEFISLGVHIKKTANKLIINQMTRSLQK